MGGHYDHSAHTCTVDKASTDARSIMPQCRAACGRQVLSDEHGSCYAFERLSSNVYREQFRWSDSCWAQMDNFFSVCVDKNQKGICADANDWMHSPGSYIEPTRGVVVTDVEQLAFRCKTFLNRGGCETAVCRWTERPEVYEKPLQQTEEEFSQACLLAEGTYDPRERECVLANCSPMQHPLLPIDLTPVSSID